MLHCPQLHQSNQFTEVQLSDTIEALKTQIEAADGIPADQQRIMYVADGVSSF